MRRHRDNLFTTNSFETSVFSSGTHSANRSVMCRLVNCFINAFNTKMKIPKWIVIVMEDDLIRNLPTRNKGMTAAYKKSISWMMTEQKKAVNRFKCYLPTRAKKHMNWPMIVWITPTLHVFYHNFNQRKKCTRALRAAADDHDIIILPLRQVWDYKNTDLFTAAQLKYTNTGLTTLWTAVDRSIKFVDQRVSRNPGKGLSELFCNDHNEEDIFTQTSAEREAVTLHNSDFIPNFFRNHQYQENPRAESRKLPEIKRRLNFDEWINCQNGKHIGEHYYIDETEF